MQNTLPVKTGISLKPQHYDLILESSPQIGWFEVHPENYMGDGGAPHNYLTKIRSQYPLSMHGVGMSLGSATDIDKSHLKSLCLLNERYQPQLISEHLSWSRFKDTYVNDLLPLPYNEESLDVMSRNIDIVQSALGRQILIENPSAYLAFNIGEFSEPQFLNELVKRSGCGLLLDVNNIFVSACNQGFDPYEYLSRLDTGPVGEIHLAGHAVQVIDGAEVRIDDHGTRITDEVWKLYKAALDIVDKQLPTLIEWDTNIPELPVLISQMETADTLMMQTFPSSQSSVA